MAGIGDGAPGPGTARPPLRRPFVFVDIDTQRDFLEPGGALFLPGSEAIRGNLRRLTELARRWRIPVVATACAHTLDEEDPEPFPPHCLVGTEGQRRIEETAWDGGRVLRLGEAYAPAATGPIPAHLTIEKARYDAFSRAETAEVFEGLSARSGGDPTFVVYGVATDYCVACAARGLLERGHRVVLVVDAIHAVDRERGADRLAELTAAGAVLASTDAVAQGVSAAPAGG